MFCRLRPTARPISIYFYCQCCSLSTAHFAVFRETNSYDYFILYRQCDFLISLHQPSFFSPVHVVHETFESVQYEHKLCSRNINVQLNIVSFQWEYEFVYLKFVQDVARSMYFHACLWWPHHTLVNVRTDSLIISDFPWCQVNTRGRLIEWFLLRFFFNSRGSSLRFLYTVIATSSSFKASHRPSFKFDDRFVERGEAKIH